MPRPGASHPPLAANWKLETWRLLGVPVSVRAAYSSGSGRRSSRTWKVRRPRALHRDRKQVAAEGAGAGAQEARAQEQVAAEGAAAATEAEERNAGPGPGAQGPRPQEQVAAEGAGRGRRENAGRGRSTDRNAGPEPGAQEAGAEEQVAGEGATAATEIDVK